MNSRMLMFEKDGMKFNCRSVAVIVNDGKILLHQIGDNPYWSLPGGRVEFMESAAQTVIRELKEELTIDCEVIRPLWVMENFFSYKQADIHEIAFYFLVTCPPKLLNFGTDFLCYENNVKLHFRWISLDLIGETELYPTFLRSAIKSLPSNIEYIVHHG